MDNPARQLHRLGQSLWLDSITRQLLDSGTLAEYRDQYAVTGLTSNPTIFDKAISSGHDYDAAIRDSGHDEPEALFFDLAIADLRRAADIFAPVFERTHGVDGWVSLEVSPLLADDADATIEQACDLHRRAQRDNLFIKVPGTQAGTDAIEELIYRGVPINVTLLFSPAQYLAAAEAWLRGLERRADEDKALDVASVASIFISRWDAKVADQLPEALRNGLGLAVAQAVYAEYRRVLEAPRVQRLLNLGARPQRLLWASTGTKDPNAPDVLYAEHLAAPLTINTMPEKTLLAYADHGHAAPELMACDRTRAAASLARYTQYCGEAEALAETLQKEGADAFEKSWRDLLNTLQDRIRAAA